MIKMPQIFKYVMGYDHDIEFTWIQQMPVHLKGTVQLLYIYTGNLRTTAHNLQSNAINSTKVLTDRRSHSYTKS